MLGALDGVTGDGGIGSGLTRYIVVMSGVRGTSSDGTGGGVDDRRTLAAGESIGVEGGEGPICGVSSYGSLNMRSEWIDEASDCRRLFLFLVGDGSTGGDSRIGVAAMNILEMD